MKIIIALCVVAFAACVMAETCSHQPDCTETTCSQDHGWFLHCTSGMCVCQHDTHTGKPCADGQTSTCVALHDNRCQDHGLHWVCLDNACHCTKAGGN